MQTRASNLLGRWISEAYGSVQLFYEIKTAQTFFVRGVLFILRKTSGENLISKVSLLIGVCISSSPEREDQVPASQTL